MPRAQATRMAIHACAPTMHHMPTGAPSVSVAVRVAPEFPLVEVLLLGRRRPDIINNNKVNFRWDLDMILCMDDIPLLHFLPRFLRRRGQGRQNGDVISISPFLSLLRIFSVLAFQPGRPPWGYRRWALPRT